VRVVEQVEGCGHGEPYDPIEVDVLFNERTVALRGPWRPTDLVKIGPTAGDLADLYEYHLDFPGNALSPGCDYELWGRRISNGTRPSVYAHVATDPGHPGKLALQYWIFYVFNDWNNLHEGDWEMIQLVFDAEDAARRSARIRSRSATASIRAPSRPTGTTTSWSSSTVGGLSSTPRQGPTRTSSTMPCSSAARGNRASA
jgi:hypothetical protein